MTAVEWLENQMKTSKYFYKLMEDINSRSTIAQSDIIEQAKAMHKEEICQFVSDYLDDADYGMVVTIMTIVDTLSSFIRFRFFFLNSKT